MFVKVLDALIEGNFPLLLVQVVRGQTFQRQLHAHPMSVEVEGDKVTVRKGDNETTVGRK